MGLPYTKSLDKSLITDNNVEIVGALVRSDRRLTVRIIASELNLNHTMVHQVLTEELAMKKLCAKFVPTNVPIEQKDNLKDVRLHLLERNKGTEISRRM